MSAEEKQFDIRKLIGHQFMEPKGEIEVRGYFIQKFIQFESLVNMLILNQLKEQVINDVYAMGWKDKQKLFFKALATISIVKGSPHFKAFEDLLPNVVSKRHAMAHWVWTVAQSDGDEISIKFEKPGVESLLINKESIVKYKVDLEELKERLSIILTSLRKE